MLSSMTRACMFIPYSCYYNLDWIYQEILINQKLIEKRDTKDRELRELKKRMAVFEEEIRKRDEYFERVNIVQQDTDIFV
jgi:hypothetical protein